VQDFQRRRAAPCRNVSESTDQLGSTVTTLKSFRLKHRPGIPDVGRAVLANSVRLHKGSDSRIRDFHILESKAPNSSGVSVKVQGHKGGPTMKVI